MSQKSLLIIGGSGNLGKAIVQKFTQNWKVLNIDINQNEQSSQNIILNKNDYNFEEISQVYHQIEQFNSKYDSIICTAGGWAGGSIKDQDIFKKMDQMQKMNTNTALLTSHLATRYLNNQGLLLFTGAALPFKQPAPGMLAYVLSKTATHAISMNAAKREEIPKDSTVATILPEVIDTPENRAAMPDQDFSKWTAPSQIADLLKMWAEGSNRPENGSFCLLKNEKGMVVTEFV